MTNYFKNVYINGKFSLLSSKENEPIVKKYTDKFIDDYYIGERTVELAEAKYQSITIDGLMKKMRVNSEDIDLLISTDLQNQIFASNWNASNYNIPLLGIYSACAGFAQGLIIAAYIAESNKSNIIVSASSNNLVSEKQFRFPVEYGAVRKMVNSFTASGSVSAFISNKKEGIKIESATIGKVIKTNHKDANDMGSAMAPSCAEVINKHLIDTNRNADYYDVILTGDLGEYGVKIMKEYFKKISNSELKNVIDCGSIFYKKETIYAGASGPVCAPLVLFDYILKNNKNKKILLCATGALHSVLSCNLGLPMPGISHAISLEVL